MSPVSGAGERHVIRSATPADAAEAIDVVRRSIEILCRADHGNDPKTLERWLANKDPETFVKWIANPEHYCVVAEVGRKVRGVGLLHSDGALLLFYISPDHQRRGLGREIHAALEDRARSLGLTRLHLQSTDRARPFYVSMGYRPAGESRALFGVLRAYPYEKMLAA